MKAKLHFLIILIIASFSSDAQTISIVGTGVNGWPENAVGPEIVLSTTDNVSFTINHLEVSDGLVKFRQNLSWTTNWGGSTFPSGTGISNGTNIITTAGTYDVTFNISNATYTFIPSTDFPQIGIWGPAVDSQNGYAGADVDMSTTDGITYTLSGFYFSSGQAYFRQDNATNFVWGSTGYPTGTATISGPSLFIPGGEHFVIFNRNTGAYSFAFPSIGILGTALSGYDAEDINLETSDGFTYFLSQLNLTVGTVKFRKDNLWTANWGGGTFPIGVGTQDGPNIPINNESDYAISFNRLTGAYQFAQMLRQETFETEKIRIYPNPTVDVWKFSHPNQMIMKIQIMDVTGKAVSRTNLQSREAVIDASGLSQGIYFAEITMDLATEIIKLVRQ